MFITYEQLILKLKHAEKLSTIPLASRKVKLPFYRANNMQETTSFVTCSLLFLLTKVAARHCCLRMCAKL